MKSFLTMTPAERDAIAIQAGKGLASIVDPFYAAVKALTHGKPVLSGEAKPTKGNRERSAKPKRKSDTIDKP